ncbi:TetR/AcrR family transcriptional regulator [Catellatospora sichuanensis]|uniref:TetR/AcrR family transcriptional regulator n=1 Tax=Catellatospora sichuanensis TaxID=1969805 RepID=UPI0011845832|nr:TetR/AcrR family transcriptional regulator [Catellatospora sichuanensis]
MTGVRVNRTQRGPGRPREERVTGAVLSAVLDLVAEQGVSAVTMDAVAARAGVSKPAIYRRWPGKHDLFIAAAETRVGVLSVPDLGDFRAELRAVLDARVEVYRMPGTARLLAGMVVAAEEGGEVREAYLRYAARIMSETRKILERGIARGDVRADVDVQAAATLVAAPLIFRLMIEQELPDDRFAADLADMIARAVGAA